MNKKNILKQAQKLIKMHEEGKLGGEVMPEDANPEFDVATAENYLYFTLPMALNYQRDSYKLWEAALKTIQDTETKDVFDPVKVVEMSWNEVQAKLTKYKVALQPNKHPTLTNRCEYLLL